MKEMKGRCQGPGMTGMIILFVISGEIMVGLRMVHSEMRFMECLIMKVL